jgi:uncharacterized protein (TIGR02996 family)
MDEEAFIAAILAEPRNDTIRLVYADWLEDRGDIRSEWLRITTQLQELLWNDPPKEMRSNVQRIKSITTLQRRFRELRAIIPEKWALRIQQGGIEHCNMVGWVSCPSNWLKLQESEEPTQRICRECQRWVRFCWSSSEVHEALLDRQPIGKALVLISTKT